jgi:hypothetical protein
MSQRGKPFEPGNKFGRGRPRGSRNKKTLLLESLLEDRAPTIIRKGLRMAEQGDPGMLRFILERILPRSKDLPVKIGRLPMSTAEERLQSHEMVMRQIASGKLTPALGQQIDSLIESHGRLQEAQQMERRVQHLEKLLQEIREPEAYPPPEIRSAEEDEEPESTTR